MQKLKNNEARPKFTGSFNPIPPGEGEGRGGRRSARADFNFREPS